MNEDELIAAFGGLRKMEFITGTITDQVAPPGKVKCVVEHCPTLIAEATGRVMCRYHVGKRKRGEV